MPPSSPPSQVNREIFSVDTRSAPPRPRAYHSLVTLGTQVGPPHSSWENFILEHWSQGGDPAAYYVVGAPSVMPSISLMPRALPSPSFAAHVLLPRLAPSPHESPLPPPPLGSATSLAARRRRGRAPSRCAPRSSSTPSTPSRARGGSRSRRARRPSRAPTTAP